MLGHSGVALAGFWSVLLLALAVLFFGTPPMNVSSATTVPVTISASGSRFMALRSR